MPRTLQVDVWFDLVCPWCWIGRGLLGQARERLAVSDPDVHVDVRWHPVQLIPEVPPEGWPFDAFYERRLGSAEAVRARQAQVLAAAEHAGVPIDYTSITVFPSTAAAHGLLAQAAAQLPARAFEALLQRLFEAYFVRSENLGDPATLAAIAAVYEVDPGEQPPAAAPDSPLPATGVPFFTFNRRLALSGAQPAEVLWAAMRQSLEPAPQAAPLAASAAVC